MNQYIRFWFPANGLTVHVIDIRMLTGRLNCAISTNFKKTRRSRSNARSETVQRGRTMQRECASRHNPHRAILGFQFLRTCVLRAVKLAANDAREWTRLKVSIYDGGTQISRLRRWPDRALPFVVSRKESAGRSTS